MTRIPRKPLVVSLSISVAAAVVFLCCLSPGSYQHLHNVSSSNIFLHLLFNSIIILIVAKEHFGSSSNELNKGFALFHFSCEVEEHDGKILSYEDEESSCMDELEDHDNGDDGDYFHGSDGYDEDDDDDGSDDEIGWDWEDDEDEEYDSELERKVEAFIAKVIRGWREEWFNDDMED